MGDGVAEEVAYFAMVLEGGLGCHFEGIWRGFKVIDGRDAVRSCDWRREGMIIRVYRKPMYLEN